VCRLSEAQRGDGEAFVGNRLQCRWGRGDPDELRFVESRSSVELCDGGFRGGLVGRPRTQSLRETLRSRGVQDVDRAIDEVKSELEDDILNPEHVLLIAQARQAKGAGANAAPGAPQPNLAAPPSAPLPQPAMQEGPPVPLPPTAGTEGEGGGVPGGGMNVPGMPRELAGMGGNMGAGVPTPGVNLGGGGMG